MSPTRHCSSPRTKPISSPASRCRSMAGRWSRSADSPRLCPTRRRERVEGLLGGAQFGLAEAHRGEEGFAHLGRLAGLEDVALQVATAERVAHDFAAREPLDEVLALGDRQRDRAVERGIADYRLRVATLADRFEV